MVIWMFSEKDDGTMVQSLLDQIGAFCLKMKTLIPKSKNLNIYQVH